MKVLIADDSFDWLNTHSLMMQGIFGDDVEIAGACSAAEGLEIYKKDYAEKPFDLVITDLQMEKDFEPLFAGEWLVREIKELRPNQKILIVSSAYNIDLIANNYNVDYISKRSIVADMENYKNKLKNMYS